MDIDNIKLAHGLLEKAQEAEKISDHIMRFLEKKENTDVTNKDFLLSLFNGEKRNLLSNFNREEAASAAIVAIMIHLNEKQQLLLDKIKTLN
jgi:hypothetical protein